MATEISASYIEDARQFIVALLQDSGAFADADFGPGSVHHDRTVKPLAYIVAWLRTELDAVEMRTDIARVLDIEDEDERNAAVDAWANNLLAQRRTGTFARGVAALHFDTPVSGIVPQDFQVSSGGTVYVLDALEPVFFTSEDMVRSVTSPGAAGDTYVLSVPMVALDSGEAGNRDPGVFPEYTTFTTRLVKVENPTGMTGGGEQESAEEFIARLPELLTVRNFVTPRAIGAVVDEQLPQAVRRQVIGAGDPEMSRDQPHVQFNGGPIHVGGHVDLYVHTNLAPRVARLPIGGAYTHPSERLRMFTDVDFVDRGVDFRALASPGAVLRIYTPLAGEGSIYVIDTVERDHLRVAPTVLFRQMRPVRAHAGREYTGVAFDGTSRFTVSAALSEFVEGDAPGGYVHVIDGSLGLMLRIVDVEAINDRGYGSIVVVEITAAQAASLGVAGLTLRVFDGAMAYSVGTNGPAYDDMIPRREFGQVTRTGSVRGAVVLPRGPVYRIHEVGLELPGDPAFDEFSGTVRLTDRLNELPPTPGLDGFVVSWLDPRRAHSRASRAVVRIGNDDPRSGSSGTFVPDGFDPDRGTLTDAGFVFSPGDVGKHILFEQPEDVGLALLFQVETYLTPTSVGLVRVSSALESMPLVFEAGLRWRFDATQVYDGIGAVVLYETLPDLETFDLAFAGDDARVVCTYPLARGYHPVIATMTLRYSLKPNATTPLDEDAAARDIVEFLRTFDTTDVLHVDDLTTLVRENYPQVGVIYRDDPDLVVFYDLYSPTGAVIRFASKGEIALDPAYALSQEDADALGVAMSYGVSDRTSMVLSAVDLITFEEVD